VPPDFEFTARDGKRADLLWNHRRDGATDLYFIANHLPESSIAEAVFRVSGRRPELWYPETGRIEPAAGWREEKGRTIMPLKLEADESVFVVFRAPVSSQLPNEVKPRRLITELPVQTEIAGPWEVRFTPGWGAPAQATFPQLTPWNENSDDGIRHYSGTAVYVKESTLQPPAEGRRLILDLGRVAVLARVRVNGRDLGVLWKEPYAVDITEAVKTGTNRLEIEVINVWVNRLVADAGLPAEKRLTWATFNPHRPGDKLLESGLLGPVQLRTAASD
jgi:hypothetical protein